VDGDATAAKEVAQSVFVDLAQKAGSLSNRLLLTSWLYTSTRFAASKVRRSERRRRDREQAAAAMLEPVSQPPTERHWAELSPILDEAMALLDVADRDAILLRFFEGKPFRSVGTVLGVGEDAARMRVNRALETLRSHFERHGVRLSVTALAAALSCEAVKAAPNGLASSISAAALGRAATGVGALLVLARALTVSKVKAVIAGIAVIAAVAIPVLSRHATASKLRQQIAAPTPSARTRSADGTPPNPAQTFQFPEAPQPGMQLQPGPQSLQRPLPPEVLPANRDLPVAAQREALRGPRRSPDSGFDEARQRMVAEQLVRRGIASQAVLQAMGTVKRQSFTLSEELAYAYADRMLGLRYSQPVETPYVTACVAERIEPKPTDRVLEIDTGFGYQTAVLSQLVGAVYSVESPSQWADKDLQTLGYTNNVFVRQGDFTRGWPEAAPFDSIVVNGSADRVTPSLVEQLKPGGRLVVPVGEDNNLHVFVKMGGQLVPYATWPVRPQPVLGNEVVLPPRRKITLAP
jgi:protein-L-isoaspartate(D-aspartate) O-methyltransferase